ncbi:ABC transporter permease [Lentisphaerota bacterium WC36G]|nr:ABC transporter permease [Lentisphaerae bacterium WC36]
MYLYFLKRICLAIFTLFVILTVSYTLLRLAPGDPTKSSMLSENSSSNQGLDSEKGLEETGNYLEKKLHLDKPIYVGLFYWFKDALRGDFGVSASFDKGEPVKDIILRRMWVSLRLNIWAILISYFIAVPLGIYSAVFTKSHSDKVITLWLFILYSLPVFWVAICLQALLCKGGFYGVFPISGQPDFPTESLSTWEIFCKSAMYYILPVACLSYGGLASLSRYVRSGMLEVLHKEYIRTARSKGVPESVVIMKHAFRNALILMITIFAGLLPGLIAGSVMVEWVFNIEGMGWLSMSALSSRDYPILMALFAISGILTLTGIFISDMLYVLADPRISFKGR